MPSVFVCYRREDTAAYAGWLRQSLVDSLGKQQVFMDIDTIAPGEDFEHVIHYTLDKADVVLVLIGSKWATLQDETGLRRLDDPDDYVRLEIASALTRQIRVIPVLVGGARLPKSDQLPDDVRKLVRRQAIELSDTRWEYDTERLIGSIRQVAGIPMAAPTPAAATPFESAPVPTPRVVLPTPVAATPEPAIAVAGVAVSTSVSRDVREAARPSIDAVIATELAAQDAAAAYSAPRVDDPNPGLSGRVARCCAGAGSWYLAAALVELGSLPASMLGGICGAVNMLFVTENFSKRPHPAVRAGLMAFAAAVSAAVFSWFKFVEDGGIVCAALILGFLTVPL